MTIPAAILAILAFVVGFLFYCVIAALTGCLVSKNPTMWHPHRSVPVPCRYKLAGLLPGTYNRQWKNTVNSEIHPFTAPFCLPSGHTYRTVGYGGGIAALLLLSASRCW